MDDRQPNGFIEYEGTLTEAECEDLKRYPQELRDQHQPWPLPEINAIIDEEEADHALARSKWAPKDCACPWPWPLNGQHIRTNCPARTQQDWPCR